MDPILIFLLDNRLLQVIVFFLQFLCFIQVFLFELRVQGIPPLGGLCEEHRRLKVINLVQLFLQLVLVLLQEDRVSCLRFLDSSSVSEWLLWVLVFLLGFFDKVIVSIDLIEINIFRHCPIYN
jgi:hypothetical protein